MTADQLHTLPELLTLKQACEVLQCHPNTLRLWDKKGILKAVRFGARGDRRYRKEDIMELIEQSDAVSEDTVRPAHTADTGESVKSVTPIATDDTIQEIHPMKKGTYFSIPLFASTVPAGFPSPADDFVEDKLDLNELVVKHPAATFFVKARGSSMINAGITSGDILVVDRSVEPRHNAIIIAILNGELTVKRIQKKDEHIFLMPENPAYKPIPITGEMDFEVWGTVTHVIHQTK